MTRGVEPDWLVACLCAEWCGSCREYRAPFDAVTKSLPGIARFAWIDIEDRPEVLGDLEVETFPTVIIARDGELAFFGPLEPHAAMLTALVRRAVAGGLGRIDDPALVALASRVRAAVA